jgi:poly(hydroxyalkanoate) depolymerase family esterase
MTKNLTKRWMGGMRRVFRQSAQTMPGVLSAAGTPLAEMLDAATTEFLTSAATPAAPRESRVRPRSADWAAGAWTRGELPLQPTLGRAAQHLSYGLYVPPGIAPEGLPLVVMLHGCQQNIDQFAQGTRMNLLADRHGFAVLYPEQSRRAHIHGCWHWYEAPEHAGEGEARAMIDLIDQLIDDYGFDGRRVFVAGLSAGAGLASLLALNYPQRFRAVAMHSGPAFGEAHSGIAAMDVMRRGLRQDPVAVVDAAVAPGTYPGMPALIVHGTDDHVVVPANAEQLTVEFLRLNQMADAQGALKGAERIDVPLDGFTLSDFRGKQGRTMVRLCTVEGLEHAWSGGDDAVPYHASAGPDASAMIWQFFAEHGKR